MTNQGQKPDLQTNEYLMSSDPKLPMEWEFIKLESLFTFKNGVNASKEDYGKGVKFINVSEIFNNNSIRADAIPGSVAVSEDVVEKYAVKRGDVLFNRTSETQEEIAFASVYLDDEIVVFGGFVIRARPINERMDDHFKRYCFQDSFFRKQVISKGQGAIRTNIGQNDLGTIRIPLPPLPEQQKIATILSTWDKAIELTQSLIEAKEEQKKGLMQRLFAPNEDMEEYTYGEVIKEVRRSMEWDDNERYDLISVRRRSGGLFHRDTLYGHRIKTKNLRTAKEGDFLISKMQILHGASGLTTGEFDGMKISGSYIAVVSKNPTILNIEYLNWLSRTPWFYHQTYISSYGVHIEKMTFDFKAFLKLHVNLPSMEEQKKTVAILNLAEKEIMGLKRKRDALKEQKRGLMQQLLTGKTRVNMS
jgi:type I restriction enzyme, S subunit